MRAVVVNRAMAEIMVTIPTRTPQTLWGGMKRTARQSGIAQNVVGGLPALVVICGFAVSHLVWVLTDQRVWGWDRAAYGTITLRLWEAWQEGLTAWLSATIHAVGYNGPLLVWLGQFLVPLKRLTGEAESAILLINVFAATGTLWLVYVTSRRLGASRASGIAAIATCGGSQMFIELSNQYYFEGVHCFTAALAMFAALHAERRAWLRTLSATVGAVGLSFLAKVSSVTFVAPMLAYVLLSSIVPQRQIRPHARARDLFVAAAAAATAVAAVTWYAVNWSSVAFQFRKATQDQGNLYWGAPVHFPTKLEYWTQTFGEALSPFSALSGCLAIVIAIALVVAVGRCLRNTAGRWSSLMESGTVFMEGGTLFALLLAGTIIMTIVAFSLHINETARYLVPLVPLFSVLVAWSLTTLHARLLVGAVLAAQVVNALVSHDAAHAGKPFGFFPEQGVLSPKPWALSVVTSQREKRSLTEAIRLTCRVAGQRNFVVPQYASLNGAAAKFYMEKSAADRGFRCEYGEFVGFPAGFPTDPHQALEFIESFAPVDVLTVVSENQPPFRYENQPLSDLFKFNVVTRPVTEHLAHDSAYEPVPCCGGDILIYRRIGR
jgi:hypothetical protein